MSSVSAGSSGSASGSDPYWANVVLLMETALPSSITDATGLNVITNHSVTVTGAQYQVGTSSATFNGRVFLDMPTSTDLQFVGGDFTMEAWVYFTSTQGDQQIINQDDLSSRDQTFQLRAGGNAALGFIYFQDSGRASAVARTTSNTIPLNAWTNIAVSKTGNTLKMFINGVQGYSGTEAPMYQGTNPTSLGGLDGRFFSYFGVNGYMQQIRITKGVGRYTTDFTPSAQPFPTN
jgi:hypothetical protein